MQLDLFCFQRIGSRSDRVIVGRLCLLKICFGKGDRFQAVGCIQLGQQIARQNCLARFDMDHADDAGCGEIDLGYRNGDPSVRIDPDLKIALFDQLGADRDG